MIKIILCDDEPVFLDLLEAHIHDYQKQNRLDCHIIRFNDGVDLIEHYNLGADIIFLDIAMKHLDGIETAKKIRDFDKKVIIVFITSLVKYALIGYTLNATNYIVKPVTAKKLFQTLDRAIVKLNEQTHQYLTLKNNQGLFKLYISDIKYIETYNRHTLIHTTETDIECFMNMKTLEQELMPYSFIRCHSGFIVNIKYIASVEGTTITLTCKTQLTISQQKRKAVMKNIAVYFGDDLN